MKGFSLIETLIVLAILTIILTIVTFSFTSMRSKKQIEVTIDAIDFKLEQAKSSALAGKNGKSFGVQFSTTSYTYFSGDVYNPNDISNSSTTLPSNLQISRSLTGGSNAIIFNRMTGLPQAVGTITVSNINNASSSASITIGNGGDINVIK
jgi:prepilin-type N-terminal cleavage/methylation domain-containing protein